MAEIDSYQYWLDQIEGKSASTKELYTIYFRKFLEYVKLTPNELIELQRKAMEENGDPRENHVVESKVRAWLASMKGVKSPATCRSMLNAVRNFFALNLHPLRLLRSDTPQGDSVGSRIPEREEVIRIADAGKWKYRAAVMFLKDSGLRISDVVKICWEDKVELGNGFWNFNLVTQKKQVQACAFVGPETTRLLEQFKTKTGRIFGTTSHNMGKQLNRIILRTKIEGVSAHGLRKYFVTSMEHERIPKDYYLHMMGKKSSVYSEKRRSTLFEAYRKAYGELAIYAQKEQEKEMEDLKAEVKNLREKIRNLPVAPSIEELNKAVAKMQKQANKFFHTHLNNLVTSLLKQGVKMETINDANEEAKKLLEKT